MNSKKAASTKILPIPEETKLLIKQCFTALNNPYNKNYSFMRIELILKCNVCDEKVGYNIFEGFIMIIFFLLHILVQNLYHVT